jgi:hypothetical protein
VLHQQNHTDASAFINTPLEYYPAPSLFFVFFTNMSAQKKPRLDEQEGEVEDKAFSDSLVSIARDMLGLPKFNRKELPRFEVEAVQPSAKVLKKLRRAVRRAHRNNDTEHWNEATARVFVERVLEHVNNGFRRKYATKVSNEATVTGQEGHGRVDMTIKTGKITLLAIEVKSKRLTLGLAQNLLQLKAAREQNLKNGIDLGNTMFGIVSTGDKWVLTKAVFNADDKPAFFVSEDISLSIRGNQPPKAVLSNQLGQIHGQITRLVMEQVEKLQSSN